MVVDFKNVSSRLMEQAEQLLKGAPARPTQHLQAPPRVPRSIRRRPRASHAAFTGVPARPT